MECQLKTTRELLTTLNNVEFRYFSSRWISGVPESRGKLHFLTAEKQITQSQIFSESSHHSIGDAYLLLGPTSELNNDIK